MQKHKRAVEARDLWSLTFAGNPEVSGTGNEIAFVKTTTNADKNCYESSIWLSRRGADGCFQAPIRLTYGRAKDGGCAQDRSPKFSPDGKYLAFLSNRSGKSQIWILNVRDGGEARQLTELEESPANLEWSPDGKSIAFVMKDPKPKQEKKPGEIRTDKDVTVVERLRYKANGVPGVVDLRRRHIYIVEIESGKVSQITSGDFDDASPAISPDGSLLAFTSCREPNAEMILIPDLWVVPVAGGEPKKLTSGKGPCHGPVFSPDGRYIAYLGHENGEDSISNTEVLVVSKDGGEAMHVWNGLDRSATNGIGGDSRFDSGNNGPYWGKDSDTLYFILTDKAYSGIYKTSLSKPEVQMVAGAVPENPTVVPGFPSVVTSFSMWESPDGELTFALTGETPTTPSEIYVAVAKGEEMATCSRLTTFNDSLMAELEIVAPEHFTFRSTDGLVLDGWMMKPADYEPGRKYPAIVEIHGGPHSAYGEAFYFEFQLLCSKGYGVFFCNPRGSSGYGVEFARGVIGDWGGMDYQDVMSLKKAADKVEWVDPANVGVTGGSYGGYMTNWIVGHTDAFRAAVTQRSISNMYTKYGVSDIGWFGNKRGMGGRDLWDSEDFIMERSPIRYAPKVTTPILIIHSEQDYRCPMEQAEQWYVALKRLGKTVGFVRFAGENHELSRSGKPWNRVERLNHIVGWFDRFMK